MSSIRPLLPALKGAVPRAAIFMSGSGSNAEKLLERWRRESPPLEIVALVTDRPESSRAMELGATYDVPVIRHDIRAFYFDRGCRRITIATPEGRRIRQEWTDELRVRLASFDIDFGLFAGFVPLTNLTRHLPCLNVHPGDLTWLKDGERHLVGLHTIPIERAILEGLGYLRTSVILAESYSGKGDDMDSGPILGISGKVIIDLQGASLAELRELAAARPVQRPVGGFCDRLEAIAEHNQELLKRGGDWVVFPEVVWAFAGNRYAVDGGGGLLYRQADAWQPVRTVIYDGNGVELVEREGG